MMWEVMRLTALKIFALKLALFSTALGYMAIDLFLWHGPIWHALHTEQSEARQHTPRVAEVYGEFITPAQFARYVAEQNWLRGRSEYTPAQEATMLMELVRSTILRIRARYNDMNLPDTAEAARREVERLASRASGPEAFDAWLASQGYTREQFTLKLQAILKATALLERAVEPLCRVSDDDVAKHYELLKDNLVAPEARTVKHIFFSATEHSPDELQARAEEALRLLEQGREDFDSLARRFSDDARTAPHGGDLGRVVRTEAMPLLNDLRLFGAEALPAGKPVAMQSRWGQHILLLGEVEPERRLTLDEVRESLRSAIESAQRELAVQVYLDTAVRESFHKKHLKIHHAGK